MRRSEFDRVYREGRRWSGPYFAAYLLAAGGQSRARVGIAAPKALGSSVVRNRIKRRLREAVRLNLEKLGAQWNVVLQARKPALTAEFSELSREVERLFARCAP